MALSGSFQNLVGYNGKFGIVCEWSGQQDVPNNKTRITVRVYLRYYTVDIGSRTGSYNVGGNTGSWYATDITDYSSSSWHNSLLGSFSQDVYHNADGSANNVLIQVNYPYRGYYSSTWYENITASTYVNLDKIPRYATITQSMASRTETAIAVNWSTDATVDKLWYSSDDGANYTEVSIAESTSGSYTISGLTAYTQYLIKTKVRRKDSQLISESDAISPYTYPYPYANAMPDFMIGNTLTIGIYNPLNRSVTVELIGADDSVIGSGTTSGASIAGFKTAGMIDNLYASIPNAQSGTYKVRVTYGTEISLKTGGTYSVNPSVCSPAITGASYQDVNSTAVAITQNNQDIVRNQSTVQYSATGLTAKNHSAIASCSVAVNGNTYQLTVSGTSATGGNASIDSGTDVEAVFTMTDSRGLTATKTITVHMLDWTVPSAIITLQRHDNFYSETDLTVDAMFPYINGHNQITITYQATKEGDSSPSVSGSLQDNVTSVVTLDNNYAWTVQVTLADSFGGTTTYTVMISRGMPIIYFDRIKSSVGINCFPQYDKSLEVNGALLEDFITEQGTSGIWTYRKYASGVVECWGTASEDSLTWTALNGFYYSNSWDVQYPFSIYDATANANIIQAGQNLGWVGNANTEVSNSSVRLYIFRISNSGTVKVGLHIIGKLTQ